MKKGSTKKDGKSSEGVSSNKQNNSTGVSNSIAELFKRIESRRKFAL